MSVRHLTTVCFAGWQDSLKKFIPIISMFYVFCIICYKQRYKYHVFMQKGFEDEASHAIFKVFLQFSDL